MHTVSEIAEANKGKGVDDSVRNCERNNSVEKCGYKCKLALLKSVSNPAENDRQQRYHRSKEHYNKVDSKGNVGGNVYVTKEITSVNSVLNNRFNK